MRRSCLVVTLVASALVAVPVTGAAAPFSHMVVFGDSLSDSGNVFAATGGAFPPAPYAQRFSNGPVAVEYLAAAWGIPMQNLALGGATTGTENLLNTTVPALGGMLPGMQTLFDAYIASLGGGNVDPTALFIVWGGPNDLFLAQVLGRDPLATLDLAVANVAAMVGTLAARGAGSVLVPGMPDLGLTPAFDGQEATGTFLTNYFNARLAAAVVPLGGVYFDSAGLLRDIVANGPLYGFTNVDDACFTPTPAFLCGMTPEQQNRYLFWDGVHPTTRGHQIAAAGFRQAVPEPATLLLVGIGCLALARRRMGLPVG
jgi:phospholipase/lecithinase/hemolysin